MGGVHADEARIDRMHERVVDLEVADVLDAVGEHVIERSGVAQGAQRTAVAIGVHGDLVGFGQQQLAVHGQRGQRALGEEHHGVRAQAEMTVLREECARRGIVHGARHDVPADHGAVAPPRGVDLFGEDPEEWRTQDRCCGEGALGGIPPKARALAAGHHEARNLASAQQGLAMRCPRRIVRRTADDRGRREIGRQHEAAVVVERGREGADLLERQGVDLVEQPIEPHRVKALGVTQHVLLPMAGEPLAGPFQSRRERDHGCGRSGSDQPSGR